MNNLNDFIIVAHRGASGYELENSIAAFKKAIELEARMIETDAQRSKDGEIVLMHDNSIKKVTDQKGFISKLSIEKLREISLNNGESIPTYQDLIDLCQNKIKINLEIKAKNIEKKVIDITLKNNAIENVIFSSFSLNTLKKIRALNSKARLAYLIILEGTIIAKLDFWMKKITDLEIESINPLHKFISSKLVQEAHKKNISVIPWTVNDATRIRDLIQEFYIDGVFTDYPDILNK